MKGGQREHPRVVETSKEPAATSPLAPPDVPRMGCAARELRSSATTARSRSSDSSRRNLSSATRAGKDSASLSRANGSPGSAPARSGSLLAVALLSVLARGSRVPAPGLRPTPSPSPTLPALTISARKDSGRVSHAPSTGGESGLDSFLLRKDAEAQLSPGWPHLATRVQCHRLSVSHSRILLQESSPALASEMAERVARTLDLRQPRRQRDNHAWSDGAQRRRV